VTQVSGIQVGDIVITSITEVSSRRLGGGMLRGASDGVASGEGAVRRLLATSVDVSAEIKTQQARFSQ
jgi:hypothetical protein